MGKSSPSWDIFPLSLQHKTKSLIVKLRRWMVENCVFHALRRTPTCRWCKSFDRIYPPSTGNWRDPLSASVRIHIIRHGYFIYIYLYPLKENSILFPEEINFIFSRKSSIPQIGRCTLQDIITLKIKQQSQIQQEVWGLFGKANSKTTFYWWWYLF